IEIDVASHAKVKDFRLVRRVVFDISKGSPPPAKAKTTSPAPTPAPAEPPSKPEPIPVIEDTVPEILEAPVTEDESITQSIEEAMTEAEDTAPSITATTEEA